MTQMPGRINDSVKQDILARADIGAIVGRYVALKQAGSNLKGLCPFHKEKTPSFNVNPSRGFYHCFGCGKGGDIFSFLMEIEGMSFPETLRLLAGELGIAIENSSDATPGEVNPDFPSKTVMLDIHATAARFYYNQIREFPQAIEYFKKRGLTPEIVRDFMLGYAPPGWSNLVDHLRSENITDAALVACGLALVKEGNASAYDRFRDRIIFPLHDMAGKCIGFAGRGMTDDAMPKYLNSPETPIYHKSRTLYGLYKARQAIKDCAFVYVVEGYMDYLAMYQAGICNVVATSGTAMTVDHGQIIRRFTGRVVLLFDGDGAGQKAAERAVFTLTPTGLDIRVMSLPDALDPDEFIRDRGVDVFKALTNAARNATIFIIDKAIEQAGSLSPQGKSTAVKYLQPIIDGMSDQIIRHEFVKQIAGRLDLDPTLISRGNELPPVEEPVVADTRIIDANSFLTTPEGKLIRLMALYPDAARWCIEARCDMMLSEKVATKLYSLIELSLADGASIEQVTAEADPELKRMIAAILAGEHGTENALQECSHVYKQLRRKYFKNAIQARRLHMKSEPHRMAELLAEIKELSQEFRELDSTP